MKLKSAPLLALAIGAALLTGCTSMINVPPYPAADAWSPDVKPLGTVTADSGRWPLSLNSVPPNETFYAPLRAKAAAKYSVPESEVVLRNISVKIGAEMDGTIRDWKATAEAGDKKGGATGSSVAASLFELKKLLDEGAITPADYAAKKKELLRRL